MNKNRKGFTIVELVIVIAVIAILAAVLIPTFASLIAKANVSADTQLVKNLNTALLTEKAGGENNKTMYDALMMVKNAGYDIDTIVSKSGNNIAWDSANDRFVLIDSEKNTFIYPTESGANAQNIGDDAVKYFVIYKELPTKENQKYSIYLSKNANVTAAEVKVGFDAGENENVTTVNYDTDAEQSVIIRTNSTNTALSIKGAKSTVKHYDKVGNVLVTEVAANSYHEFGEVQGNILLANGRVVMETGSKAAAIKVTATADDITNGNAVVSVDNTAASTVAVVVPADVKTALETKGGDNKITANADSVVTDANVIANMEKFAGGLGTAESPFIINDATQFGNLASLNDEKIYITFAKGAVIDSETEIALALTGKELYIDGNGAELKGALNLTSAYVSLNNVKFTFQGQNGKSRVTANKIKADGVSITNSYIAIKARTGLSLSVKNAEIKDNTFDSVASLVYNIIEFGLGEGNNNVSSVDISNNKFVGQCENNCISVYNMSENAVVNIKDNQFGYVANALRISNPNNVSATFNLENNSYTGTSFFDNYKYAGFIILEDYSKTSTQNFTKLTVNIANLTFNGEKITARNTNTEKQSYYVYDDNKGLMTTTNQPVVNFN